MRGPELDLPLHGSPTSRFLLWSMAALIYLAVLAFGIAAIADVQLAGFHRQPRVVTVALPPNPDRAAARQEVQDVLALVRARPGVAYASVIDAAEIDSLVRPWLGADAAPGALPGDSAAIGIPLPRLIDIAYNPGAMVDLTALDRDLVTVVPGATIGDSGLLRRSQERLAAIFRMAGVTFGLLAVALAVLAAVLITRVDLRSNAQTIDLLRLLGANDGYIARQLEHHALAFTLRGAVMGFMAAISTIVLALYLPAWLGDSVLFGEALAPAHWLLLAIVPVATTLLVAIAARLAAHFGLAPRH